MPSTRLQRHIMKIESPPRTEIDGIRLRRIERADCTDWYAYLSRPEVFERTSWNLQSIDDLRSIMEAYLDDSPTAPLRLAAVDAVSGRLVGTVGLHTISEGNRSAEMAYDLAPSHWGRGLATGMCAAVTAWSFEVLGLHRVQATVLAGNQRSQRVLARCHFQHEGLLRGYRMVRGRPGDFNIYSRLATDGDAGSAAAGA